MAGKETIFKSKFSKKLFITLLSAITSSLALIILYLYLPISIQSLDGRLRDFLFLVRGAKTTQSPIVIIDIDEKSLRELGQFPWERRVMGILLDKIAKSGASTIGINLPFVEVDKSSPSYFAKKHKIPGKFPNYDYELAYVLQKTPSILGYGFDFEKAHQEGIAPYINALFVENDMPDKEYLLQAKGVISNYSTLQDAVSTSGFFNNIADNSGVIRSVPLLVRYDGLVYPSLVFEMYRTVAKKEYIQINYDTKGINTIDLEGETIQTDKNGRIYINYKGPKYTYTYMSASDIIKNRIKTAELKDKFILIGTSATTLKDLRTTPYGNTMPGVEIHANVLDNLLQKNYLTKPVFAEKFNLIIIASLSFFMIICIIYFPLRYLIPFLIVVLGLVFMGYYYLTFNYYLILNILYPIATIILCSIIGLVISYFLEERQKENIKSRFAKKVSEKVMEDLLEADADNPLGGEEKEVTIFFSDIRAFSSLSEKLPPQKLVQLLNAYLSPMSDIIRQHNGVIDKFIGDSIMAYWNAPKENENHADDAISAALEQIDYHPTLNDELAKNFNARINFGIGINTGFAIVGEMGSHDRSDYTVIGNSINLAARLEGLCPVYGAKLIISKRTKERLKTDYNFLQLDTIRAKGIKEPVDIYTILEKNDENYSFKKQFESSFFLYKQSKFQEALESFIAINSSVMPALKGLYIERCKEYVENAPKNFDGIYTYTHK